MTMNCVKDEMSKKGVSAEIMLGYERKIHVAPTPPEWERDRKRFTSLSPPGRY